MTGNLPMIRPTRVEVDLAALCSNARQLSALATQKNAKLMAVVKADGYGHGAVQVARAALQGGAAWLAVSLPEEGEILRQAGVAVPILVLGALLPGATHMIAWDNLSLTVFDSETVEALEMLGAARGCQIRVHVKLDTGMNRIGAKGMQALDAVMAALDASPHVVWEGTYTHFAKADDADLSFTIQQIERFEEMLAHIRETGHAPGLIHAANSAGLIVSAAMSRLDCCYDLVRAGIALYGYAPSEETLLPGLQPALSWKTAVVHVKEVHAGESISYGGRYTAEETRRIATLPVGYADGFHRAIGNDEDAHVLIRGRRAPLRGRVCMDQCMVDVTDIPDVTVGDIAVLLGAYDDEQITADDMGQWGDTIHWEILTSIGPRVERIYINGNW